jgi:exodeoxyribonuclease VII small subunit
MKNNDFESSILELEDIVKKLECGTLSLDESIAAFEKAMGLVRLCNEKLESAEQRIRLLTEAADGSVTDIPFEISDAT